MSRLFPDHDERRLWNQHLGTALTAALQRVSVGRVTPTVDIDGFLTRLAAFDFQEPVPFEYLLDWTIEQMQDGLVHMNHPKYLGLFNPAPSYPAQCADRIAASFNPQLATATTSPAAVAIESHVIRSVISRAGLPPGAGGHFTSGGSEANYTALVCALTHSEPAFAAGGSRAFSGQPVFYISEDSHLAWVKIAHQAGIGRAAARLIPTDGDGRLSCGALKNAIEADTKQGYVPVMIVATAGTTNAGMIDPLESSGEIAKQAGIWYHVDAAWGGGVIASDRLRPLLTGIESADSVTIDAHKWFATTMGCGMYLTAHPSVLSDVFNVSASYMPSHTPSVDPYVTTAQWSRRFVGLRLFMSLGAASWAGHAAHVEHSVDLAWVLAENVKIRGWSVVNNPALAVVCMMPPPGSRGVRDIVAEVLKGGSAWISAAKFEGRDVIRACITNGETSTADVLEVVELLERCRLTRVI